MKLLVAGVNHRTAPVELREQLAIAPEQLAEATRSLVAQPGVREGMVLSTCNRVELIACHDTQRPDLRQFLECYFHIEGSLGSHVFEHVEEDAVRHIFRVTASLDSMVVGEPQILGQVKESYQVARQVGAAQGTLDRLLQSALNVAKKVRTETEIGSSSVSIASVAVDLARKIFGSLEGKRVLLVGAGKMSELAARHLIRHGAGSLMVTNRTHERALRLAQTFHGRPLRFEDLYAQADQADIVITSTGSARPIFLREHGQLFLQRRRSRPMFFIDIAVPRDVDPAMNRVEGVFLYDIDDLQSVAASHKAGRAIEAERAEAIIGEEVERYRRRLQTIEAAPVIVQLQRVMEGLRQAELKRAHGRLQAMTPEQIAVIESVTRGLANKFLHLPLKAIQGAAAAGDAGALETIRAMFRLGEAEERQLAEAGGSETVTNVNARPSAKQAEDLSEDGTLAAGERA